LDYGISRDGRQIAKITRRLKWPLQLPRRAPDYRDALRRSFINS